MKVHRFLTEYKEIGNNVFIENTDLIHQIKNVLKLRMGEKIILTDGVGKNIHITLTEISKDSIVGSVVERVISEKPSHKVHLYLSILKKENFELVAQKVTEVGVASINPIESDRTVKTGLKEERLKTIIKEALEQSGGSYLPTLEEKTNLTEALKNSPGEKYLLDMTGIPFDDLEEIPEAGSIFVGPEGGWTENEIHTAKDTGVQIVSTGNSTLRAETAAIISSFLFVNKK